MNAHLNMFQVIEACAAKAPAPIAKDCPWCGAEPLPAERRAGLWIVSCSDEDCDTQKSGATMQEAWAKWNTRVRP